MVFECTEIKSTTQRIGWRAKNCGRTRSFPEMSLSRHTASRRVLDFQLVWSMFINSCTICFLGYMVVTGLSCLRMPFAWRTSRPIFWVEVFLKLPASDATVDPFLLIGTLVPHRVPFFTKEAFQILSSNLMKRPLRSAKRSLDYCFEGLWSPDGADFHGLDLVSPWLWLCVFIRCLPTMLSAPCCPLGFLAGLHGFPLCLPPCFVRAGCPLDAVPAAPLVAVPRHCL